MIIDKYTQTTPPASASPNEQPNVTNDDAPSGDDDDDAIGNMQVEDGESLGNTELARVQRCTH